MAALVRHERHVAHPQSVAAADAGASEIARLYDALDRVSEADNPRTARLLASGRRKIAQKLMEEAGEVALEAVRHRTHAIVRESADVVYQLVVLWHVCGVSPEQVWAEMRQRADTLGIAEKLPKPVAHASAPQRAGGRPE